MKYTLLLIAFCFTTLGLQAQWETIECPKQSNLEKFAYAEGVLYGYSKHGIYKSTDEGYTWTLDRKVINRTGRLFSKYVTDGIDHYLDLGLGSSIVQVDVDGKVVDIPLNTNFLEGEFVRDIAAQSGVIYVLVGPRTLYSIDKGVTWQSVTNPEPNLFCFAFFKGAMYVAKNDKLYRSGDMGQTWVMVQQFNNAYVIQLTATPEFLFVNAGYITVHRSSDGFVSQSLETPILGKAGYDDLLAYNPSGQFSIINRDLCAGFSIKKSINGNFQNFIDTVSARYWPSDSWIKGDHWIIATNKGLLHSTDGGQSFKDNVVSPFISSDIIQVKKRDNQLAIVNNYSNLLNTPIPMVNGYNLTVSPLSFDSCMYSFGGISDVQVTATHNKIFALTYGKLYTLNQSDYNWKEIVVNKGLSDEMHSITGIGENLYIGMNYGTFTGAKFKVLSQGGDNEYDLTIPTESIKLNPFQPPIETSKNLIFSGLDPTGSLPLFINMSNDQSFSAPFPTDGCNTVVFGGTPVLRIEDDGERLYSICSGQASVYEKAKEQWQNWTPQNWNNGEPLYHKDLRFFRLHKDVFWIGVYGEGLYYATDGSGRFYKYESQPPSLDVTAVDFDGNEMWVAAADGNVYHSRMQVRKSARVESPFQVHNSPSADQRLVLQSKVPQTAPTELSVFAATGQLVHTITLPAGTDWTVELPNTVPGMYWVSLRTATGNVFTEKWVRGR
jgi:photosystem II stability/assembly factor-like uncharacterized protein